MGFLAFLVTWNKYDDDTGYACISRLDVGSISTRSGGDLLQISSDIWTYIVHRACLIVDNYRVWSANFVDIIVFIIVCLEVGV